MPAPIDRPTIEVRPPEHQVVKAAQAALARLGSVFQRSGHLVYVFRSTKPTRKGRRVPAGAPSIRPATKGWVREQVSLAARFARFKEAEKKLVDALCPEWLPSLLIEASDHGAVPILLGVSETPVMVEGGRILRAPGLDLDSGFFFAPLHDDYPSIPDRPTRAQALKALEVLMEVVQDFPFGNEHHRAAFLAAVLTAAARPAITGPVPFILIEASSQASGKGLMANVIGLIITGRDLPVMSAPRDGVELKKALLPVISEGTRLQHVDELGARFGGPEWNAVITSVIYRDRVLGSSSILEAPQNTLFVCTGNNVTLAPDSARRCLPIRLEPMVERPEDRDDFKISDLAGYVREHHQELLAAALTILKAYHAAGCPASGLRPWGSFEAWSRLIRDCVYWVSGVDCDSRKLLADAGDVSRNALAQLIDGLRDRFGSAPFNAETVRQSVEMKSHPGLVEAFEVLNGNPSGLTTKTVGRILAKYRRTVSGGHFIEAAGTQRGATVWHIRPVQAPVIALVSGQDYNPSEPVEV